MVLWDGGDSGKKSSANMWSRGVGGIQVRNLVLTCGLVWWGGGGGAQVRNLVLTCWVSGVGGSGKESSGLVGWGGFR